MTTITVWDRDGSAHPIDLAEAVRRLADPPLATQSPTQASPSAEHDAVWVAVEGADSQDLTHILDQLHLDERVAHSLEHFRRPSSEVVSGGHYLGLATLWYSPDGDLVETGEIHCVVSAGGILTVERGQAGVTQAAAAALRLDTDPTIRPSAVLTAVATAVVRAATAVSDDLGEAVTQLESQVFSTQASDPVERIYLLRREVAEARRALAPVAAALQDLATTQAASPTRQDRGSLRRLVAQVQRCADEVEGYDRLLGDMLQAHLAIVSVRQNADMRKMSAWAAIAAVCTVIAGIYGMNFANMPELHWALGYAWALGLMAVAGFILYRAFRRSGWL